MTFQEARRFLKRFIKPEAEGIDNECFELKGCGIEKQINEAMERGLGGHIFYYLQTENQILDENGKSLGIQLKLVSKTIEITEN